MFKFYHTYKKQIIPFKPVVEGKVGMYNCGPTVYNDITIGNLVAYLFADSLRRSLEYSGFEVKQVMNITDVGHLTMTDVKKELIQKSGKELEITDDEEGIDRLEKAAKKEGISTWAVAQKYIDKIFGHDYKTVQEFSKDTELGKVNMKKPTVICRATEYIEEQIEMIKQLEKNGCTYTTKDAVYFDIKKFPKFQELIGQKFEDMQKTERANTEDPERKHPADFRLWQLNQPDHEMLWDSPWGKGYPGWHIECSAMSRKNLGQPFDIHTSGEDHIKIHHPNEIAQSESAYGTTMANYWMHNAFIKVDGRRMGKSLGNAYTLKDLEDKGFSGMDYRYFLLLSHYRSTKNFTWEALQSAKNARLSLIQKLKDLKKSSDKEGQILESYKTKFLNALEDDLNIPNAVAVTWELLGSDESSKDKVATILDFDRVLGLNLKSEIDKKKKEVSPEVLELIKKREEARKNKNWELADQLRKELLEKFKVTIKDTTEGTEIVN